MSAPSDFPNWSLEEMQSKTMLVTECRETFGIEAARQLAEKLGFPRPPPELIDPLPGDRVH